jgi:ABC-type branched-subunit amino acid transport system substrate-binding protein
MNWKQLIAACVLAVLCALFAGHMAVSDPFPTVPDQALSNKGWNVLDPAFTQPFINFARPYGEPLKKPFDKYVDPTGRGSQHDDGSAKEVRIGFIGCLSGPAKAYSANQLKGTNLAIEEINARGGIGGRKIKLFIHDDKADMGRNGEEWAKMVFEDKVVGILGSMSSDTTHVGIRVSLKFEVPSMTSISTDPTITQVFTVFSFRCLADDWSQGRAMAKLVLFDLGLKKIATLQQNNRYGRMGIAELSRVYQRKGYPVKLALKFEGKATDFSSQVALVKAFEPEAVIMWGLYTPCSRLVKQLRAAGVKCPIFGADGMVSEEFPKLAGKDAEGVITTMPYDYDSPDPANREFIEKYRKNYGEEPDSFSAHGYDSARIMCAAIEKAGLNRTRIRDAIAGTKHFHGVTNPDITFDHTNNISCEVLFAKIIGGKFVPLYKIDRSEYLK